MKMSDYMVPSAQPIVTPIDNLNSLDERDEALPGQLVRKSDFIDIVRQLSQLSARRAVFAIIGQWIIIAVAAGAALASKSWMVYIVAAIVIGTRQHALAILMHDAAHYRLSRNRIINNLLSNVFLSFPLGVSTEMYRRWHFSHHRYVGTPQDPEQQYVAADPEVWNWPADRRKLWRIIGKDILGLHTVQFLRLVQPWSPALQLFARKGTIYKAPVPRKDIFYVAGFYFVILVLAFGWPVQVTVMLVLWYATMFTITLSILRIRSIAEHIAVEGTHELNSTRTVMPTWVERVIIAPFNVNYHLEHHMFPSVPWYNLGRLHDYLMNNRQFNGQAHLTSTYLDAEKGLLGEITLKQ